MNKKGLLFTFGSCLMAGAMSFGLATGTSARVNAESTDATIAAGTNGSAAKVIVDSVENAAIKVGTGKAGGNLTITVGAGATSLSFYGAAWKGSTGTEVTVTPANKVSSSSLTFVGNDGIANSSPFTFSGDPESYKFDLDLTGVSSETTFTFAASARFVVWGATYEAGGEVATLEFIAVAGDAEKLEYSAGEKFDVAGLDVTGTYSDGSLNDLTDKVNEWRVTPETLTVGTTSVSVVAVVGDKVSEPFVVEDIVVTNPPFFSHTLSAANGAFTAVAGADGLKSWAETVKFENEYWTGEGHNTKTTDTKQYLSVSAPYSTNEEQQFGTNNYPFTDLSFTSNDFGAKRIEKVIVEVRGASASTTFDLSCTVGGVSFGSPVAYSGNTYVEATFKPTADAFGSVSIKFDNILNGLFVKSIQVFGSDDTSDAALAHDFARACELEDTCDTEHTALLTKYDALSSDVKALADAITVHDWDGTPASKGNRTLAVTVAEKLNALRVGAGSASLNKMNADTNNNSVILAAIVASVTSVLAVITFAYFRKRKLAK